MAEQALSYCAIELRRLDRDRFLTGLFAPAARREDLYALYAFNLEIAKVRETVSEMLIGHIRLQWWRDTIAEIAAGAPPRRHEVAEALSQAMRAHALDPAVLLTLIDARAADLDEDPPADLAALVSYVRESAGSLAVLAARILSDAPLDDGVAAAMRDLGTGYGLAGILRAIPYRARLGRVDLPVDHLRQVGLGPRDIIDLRRSDALSRLVESIAAVARDHLTRARTHRTAVPLTLLSALLVGRLADRHLAALAKVRWDPFDPRLTRPDGLTGAALTLAAWRGVW